MWVKFTPQTKRLSLPEHRLPPDSSSQEQVPTPVACPAPQILIAKCLGRRICAHCGKNYNLADIYIPEGPGQAEVRMPPLNPPPECENHMERRADDTLAVIQKRLQVSSRV